jgi:NADPH-dependent ferric siderophore reductase
VRGNRRSYAATMTVPTAPIRREPPPFRRAAVTAVQPLTPRLLRVTLGGPELAGFPVPEPAASVRLLLPVTEGLVIPAWNGNEFRMPDGSRPPLRTLTPRHVRDEELDVDVVFHDGGRLSAWAKAVAPGAAVAISGPGRGYEIPKTGDLLLAGDETALPAIAQLLELVPAEVAVRVVVEIATPEAELPIPGVRWVASVPDAPPGTALVDTVRAEPLTDETRLWVAGEAAAVQRIRKYAFDECAIPRSHAVIRGYWKHGRAET